MGYDLHYQGPPFKSDSPRADTTRTKVQGGFRINKAGMLLLRTTMSTLDILDCESTAPPDLDPITHLFVLDAHDPLAIAARQAEIEDGTGPLIPLYKLSSNMWYLVTREEVRTALEAYDRHPRAVIDEVREYGADRLRAWPDPGFVPPCAAEDWRDVWEEWIAYLRGSLDGTGIRVG